MALASVDDNQHLRDGVVVRRMLIVTGVQKECAIGVVSMLTTQVLQQVERGIGMELLGMLKSIT